MSTPKTRGTPAAPKEAAPAGNAPWDEGETFTPGLFRFFLAWMGVPFLVSVLYVLFFDRH